MIFQHQHDYLLSAEIKVVYTDVYQIKVFDGDQIIMESTLLEDKDRAFDKLHRQMKLRDNTGGEAIKRY